MARTSISLQLLDQIRLGRVRKDELLAALDKPSPDAEKLRLSTSPMVSVLLHELRDANRWRGSIGLSMTRGNLELPDQLATDGVYTEVGSIDLRDLSSSSCVDVVRIGRSPSNDLELRDKGVSREHALVLLVGTAVHYCDYGTLRDGDTVRTGSMNGSWIEGDSLVRDAMVKWLPIHDMMLGKFLSGPAKRRVSWFKLNYRYVDPSMLN